MNLTSIKSNGSKWLGQSPDPIETLYDRLQNYPLDPTFEDYGNFAMPRRGGVWHFWGNFYNLSAVFNIQTIDPDVIATLRSLIADNQRRPDYREARAAAFAHKSDKWELGR